MRVLAFDPGFERLGVAVVEKIKKEELLYSNCLRTAASLPFPERLASLGNAVETLLKKWKPDVVALEELYFAKNEKTAMKVAEVRGMLVYVAAARGLEIYQYTPMQVKVAVTGYGGGDKKAVAAMVPRLVTLPAGKRLDDEMDAIAVGLTCLASVRIYPQK
jgi:crossover junction endodeoxyribonuclease RuvC